MTKEKGNLVLCRDVLTALKTNKQTNKKQLQHGKDKQTLTSELEQLNIFPHQGQTGLAAQAETSLAAQLWAHTACHNTGHLAPGTEEN